MRYILLTCLSLSLAAHAEQAAPTTAEARAPIEYTYHPEEVQGGVQGPDAKPIIVKLRRPTVSLIQVRRSFYARLLQSAETL